MLDYDKKFLIKSWDNLTFDGSSIRGFTAQKESDLRLGIDWAAVLLGAADYFGEGKVLVFGEVIDKDGTPYVGDIRGVLKAFANSMYDKHGYTLMRPMKSRASSSPASMPSAAITNRQFEYVKHGRLLPLAAGRSSASLYRPHAEVQRAMGFQNEKDHRKWLRRSSKSTTAMPK